MSNLLTPSDIKQWHAYTLPSQSEGIAPLEIARRRMQDTQQWAPWQMLGRRMAIGCVALEITQRCNLDCSYCYLSESSEALVDIPMQEVLRRVDLIYDHYGPHVDVQITGGDPTLRQRDELVNIVRYIKKKGMRSSLFTNGIKATRDLLTELCNAGLEDVAFHVDMTQGRPGYANEMELNRLRETYIDRARGLRLAVIFNTTAFPGNFHEIPALVKFFVRHAGVVRFASFQVGADTGRGVDKGGASVNLDSVQQAIRDGAGVDLNFGAASAGHAKCNGYAYGLIVNDKVHDVFKDAAFVHHLLASTAHLTINRTSKSDVVQTALRYLARNPGALIGTLGRFAALICKHPLDFIKGRGQVGKISFFVHSFMDAQALDKERCEACAFMVMTPEGPMSMCVHNAKRDDYLLVPAKIRHEHTIKFFNPVTGGLDDHSPTNLAVTLNRKNARGRAKAGDLQAQSPS